ncbi:hypothetical protein BDB00DRAFT_855776 [Zychaea mexicana]|uniref:uncharacterized protein n=1 Tax=Zychaea mexicana TaxID=64656 RepID=UPI0022FF0933|nr:uncharacterized protein BDB00DRAFT_855776 [Zychaea mexicana]KAI9484398.1 hypothetical protein BDB00DRAFT_855776 [Zychaea mexicana]
MSTSLLQYTLDPLYSIPLKLFIHTILSLSPFPNRRGHYLLNESRLIREAEICGTIVAVEQTYNMIIYTIDDATGTLRCIKWKHPDRKNKPRGLGTCILVRGFIGDFMGFRQITIKHLDVIKNPNREILHDLQTVYLYETLYSKPCALSEDVLEHRQAIEEELRAMHDEYFWRGVITASQIEQKQEETVEINEEFFQKQFLAHVQQEFPDDRFSYTQVMSRKDLVELASHVCVNDYKHDEPTNNGINEIFARATEIFSKKGLIVEVANGAGLFRLVKDADVQQVIYRIIRAKQETLTISFGGIMQEYIIARVRKEEKMYADLARERIIQCLEDMVLKSVLYLTRSREYKVLV